MTVQPFLIAPFNSGLVNNVEPWLIPEDAFEFLENAYVWRGRVRKRAGTYYIGSDALSSRLRIDLGNTNGSGNISTTVPGAIFSVGQMFSIGSEIFTVTTAGMAQNMLTTGSATTATYDTTNGALVINGAMATTACYFYPADPVMGLRTRESLAVNFEDTVAFDTQFAYERSGGAWTRLGSALWAGTNSDFFWTINYRGANPYETYFYVVNYTAADNIKYIPQGSSTWTNLRPQLDSGATRYLETAKIILGFKDRLLLLNTIEDESGTDRTYQNRARWSQNGDPTTAATSWLDDTPGRGGYVDAPTEQAIITAQFIQDRLVVYFEASTWELVYTGDATLPFRWQQLNNELGCESSFSIIGFDKGAVGVGNVGVHSCNGTNVSRIDEKIPTEVFNIHNADNGVDRVYGIRQYYDELVYWTYPDDNANTTFPNKILVWNYQNNSWSKFDESFTCFGNFQKSSDVTWADLGEIYGTWAKWNEPWGGPKGQSQFPFIIAGNQQGFVFIFDTNKSGKEQSLYITDMSVSSTNSQLTIYNHNLQSGDYVVVQDSEGTTGINDVVTRVTFVDTNNITVNQLFTGTYTGAGYLKQVSTLNITSRQWSPFLSAGSQFRTPYIDFFLNRTDAGEVSVDYYLDSNPDSSIQDEAATDALLGSNTLFTRPEDNQDYQANQVRIWHRYFMQSESQFIQIKVYLDDTQMRDLGIAESDFQLNAIILYVDKSGRIVG